jgi:UPF0755 protein
MIMFRSMKKIFFVLLVLILLAGAFAAWKIFGPSVSAPDGNYFYIRTGESYETVIKNLTEKNITGGFWFHLAAKRAKFSRCVKPGRYEIKDRMSIYNLVRMLKAGNQAPVNLVITKLRLPEDLAKKVGNTFECDSLQMITFLRNQDSLAVYGLDSNTVLSVILPNTYRYFWNTAPDKIFRRLVAESDKFWNAERKQKADTLGLSPKEVYILASIVEEETRLKSDKGKIASVYLNRLKKGMPLQADPTVKFAMKDFGLRRILFVHLRYPSPYNTYFVKGLPPGPICTPSAETIDEVLNAPKTDYLFFVASSSFDGSSIFTTHLTDHMKYAREYQKALTERLAAEADRKKN